MGAQPRLHLRREGGQRLPFLPRIVDQEGAGEENFLWLIATPEGALAAFVYLRGGLTGADLVTSSS